LKTKFALFLTALNLIGGCSSTANTHISQTELLHLIESGEAPLIIDVRSDSEYTASHVPGAKHIPFWKAFSTDELDEYQRDELLVLYCEHGPRAGIAKFAFGLSGFENMVYLDGHMKAWKAARLPVEDTVTDKQK
jgi:rhodanese-related sulfurtransferase